MFSIFHSQKHIKVLSTIKTINTKCSSQQNASSRINSLLQKRKVLSNTESKQTLVHPSAL